MRSNIPSAWLDPAVATIISLTATDVADEMAEISSILGWQTSELTMDLYLVISYYIELQSHEWGPLNLQSALRKWLSQRDVPVGSLQQIVACFTSV